MKELKDELKELLEKYEGIQAREVIKDLRNLNLMRELEKVKAIADANTLYPYEAKQMPYYSIMTVEEFYGPDDPEEAQKNEGGVYDRKNVVYFRFDFSKLKAIFEIWKKGELMHVEKWNPLNFNLEEFSGMVDLGSEWIVRRSDTDEIVASFYKTKGKKHPYEAWMAGKIHPFHDEVELMEFVEERLGGIRLVYCECTEGCEKCEWRSFFIVNIEEASEDAV